jgi:hypothetical protein
LSATVVNLVLHEVLKILEQSNTILKRQIFGYADEILVISRSLPALKAMCAERNR